MNKYIKIMGAAIVASLLLCITAFSEEIYPTSFLPSEENSISPVKEVKWNDDFTCTIPLSHEKGECTGYLTWVIKEDDNTIVGDFYYAWHPCDLVFRAFSGESNGRYRYAVAAIKVIDNPNGEGIVFKQLSEIRYSEWKQYTKPDLLVSTPQNPRWIDNVPAWSQDDIKGVGGYIVEFQKYNEKEEVWNTEFTRGQDNLVLFSEMKLDGHTVESNLFRCNFYEKNQQDSWDGDYRFRVRFTSRDIGTRADGDWSDWSEVKHFKKEVHNRILEGTQDAVNENEKKPLCAWKTTVASYVDLESNPKVPYTIQLVEMYEGKKAEDIVYAENEFNTKPSDSQQWIVMKFAIRNYGLKNIAAKDIINGRSFKDKNGYSAAIWTASFFGDRKANSVDNAIIKPEIKEEVWVGIIVDKSKGYPYLVIPNSIKKYNENKCWLDTNPYYVLPSEQPTESPMPVESPTPVVSPTPETSITPSVSPTSTESPTPSVGPIPAESPTPSVGPTPSFNPDSKVVTEKFSDVPTNKWYSKADGPVQYVIDNGIMNGTGNGSTFEPEKSCTRTMMVKILYNAEGAPAVTGANSFTDVASGKWFYEAVIWASQNKVTSGYSDGRFGINDDVTRQQMAKFLLNYATFKGYDVSARADLSSYPDNGSISGWAVDAMKWANANGIINGKKNKEGQLVLEPQGGASRAEVAQMIMNFQKKFGK